MRLHACMCCALLILKQLGIYHNIRLISLIDVDVYERSLNSVIIIR